MELLKLLSINEIVAQIAGFLLLLVLLRIFAWKKILGVLDERKNRIASEFKSIEDSKAEIAKLKQDYETKLDSIEMTAKKKIQQAVEEGQRITEEVRKKAFEQAEDIIEHARQDIKHELFKAKEELKEQVIDLTISATESVIQEKLTDEADKRMIKDFLKEIDKLK